tara:strand:+ start:9231 stop:9920 length:690 start_codon:yes stop_codon:yes gene_type:complete
MATVYANSSDGYVIRFNQSSWSDARDNASGTHVSSTIAAHYIGVSAYSSATRGGGTAWTIYRSFFSFDTSGITDSVDDGAVLKIYGYSNVSGDLIAVKATSDISSLGTADFNSIDGWVYNTTDGSGGGSNDGNVTKYSAEKTTWTTSGYNSITLNAQARTDMQNNDILYIALVNYDYDVLDVDPSGASDTRNGLYYQNSSGTSRDPYIDYDTTAVATTADNAIFFGANF